MKNIQIRLSSLLLGINILLLIITISGYMLLKKNLIQNHQAKKEIVLQQIQIKTQHFFSQLLYQYTIQKKQLIQKHKEVLKYLTAQKEDPTLIPLQPIFYKLNKDLSSPHYNIYITDENLTIKNTTFQHDQGFCLSFAKDIFEKHAKEKQIGVSTPLIESSTGKFFSYTDNYIPKTKKILQLSYTYKTSTKTLMNIQSYIHKFPNIAEANSYILLNNKQVNKIDFILHKNKQGLDKVIIKNNSHVNKIFQKLQQTNLLVKKFVKDRTPYETIFFVIPNPIVKEVKLLYTLTFNESSFYATIDKLQISTASLLLLELFGIVFLLYLQKKEKLFSWQEHFLQSAMHELQTPLSVITLNNELEIFEHKDSEYTKEIQKATEVLNNSLNEIGYAILENNKEYKVEKVDLQKILKERVEYFSLIAKESHKELLFFPYEENICVIISPMELTRIIDNTISNAIKYSFTHTKIYIKVTEDGFCIENQGQSIQKRKKIFDQYYRENRTKGGFGLGLFIIKQISKKYNIAIDLYSKDETTKFCYKFGTVLCT